MAKKKVSKTLKELIKEIFHNANVEYCEKWKAAWETYKTVIGPFIMGTATYVWTLVYGSLYYVGKVIYQCGKVLRDALLKLIKKV